MRLITSIGLSLLLLFGITATTGHADTGGSWIGSVATTGSHSSVVDEPVIDLAPQHVIAFPGGTTPSLGIALCALGILCGLAAIILFLRLLWCTRLASPPRSVPRAIHCVSVFTAPPRATACSLIQLSVSRT